MITLETAKELYTYTLTITDTQDIPIDLFLYRIGISGEHIFEHVCSIDELERYPSSEPNSSSPIFFRKPTLVLTDTSITALDTALEHTKELLTDLDTDYKKFVEDHSVGTTETTIIGEE